MSDEARGTGSLGPVRDQPHHQRLRGGRRSPFGQSRPASPPGRPVASSEPVYAALDLGTNNCRLLVARPTGESFRVIDAFSRIIRLGEGISATGRICDPAISRAVADRASVSVLCSASASRIRAARPGTATSPSWPLRGGVGLVWPLLLDGSFMRVVGLLVDEVSVELGRSVQADSSRTTPSVGSMAASADSGCQA